MKSANKGEWSELYAFIKLLRDGKIYAADENVQRLENIYFPIIKLIREENNDIVDYYTGRIIKIYADDVLIDEIENQELDNPVNILYKKIFDGGEDRTFRIEEAEKIMETLHLTKIKAPSKDKKDLTIQIHDINTGYEPIVGFSVKSDIGSAPTLLNAGKNTRFTYKIYGIDDNDMHEINSIDKSCMKDYMIARMNRLFEVATSVEYVSMKDDTFEDNLVMIDSKMPELYGNMILTHYRYINDKIYDIESLCEIIKSENPIEYRNVNAYRYKIKKLLCAAALGMTPGKKWDGLDNASGGYIIIKRDGDIVCYHLYNRNFFEEYLIRNTQFDRPSASKHDFGYVYKIGDEYFMDLNVQVRFKKIKAVQRDDKAKMQAYADGVRKARK